MKSGNHCLVFQKQQSPLHLFQALRVVNIAVTFLTIAPDLLKFKVIRGCTVGNQEMQSLCIV